MQSAGAHFSRDCQHKAQTSQKVKAGLSHDRRVCFRAQHGAAAGHVDGGKGNLSGRQRRISGRGTPTRATGYRFGHLCGEGCSTGGAQRELGRRERALAGRRAKIFFARWNSGGLRGCLKKEFVKKDTRRTGNLTPYPSCPFLQSPRPCRCPDAARRRSLRRASPKIGRAHV